MHTSEMFASERPRVTSAREDLVQRRLPCRERGPRLVHLRSKYRFRGGLSARVAHTVWFPPRPKAERLTASANWNAILGVGRTGRSGPGRYWRGRVQREGSAKTVDAGCAPTNETRGLPVKRRGIPRFSWDDGVTPARPAVLAFPAVQTVARVLSIVPRSASADCAAASRAIGTR
jgi:hypothetical protein